MRDSDNRRLPPILDLAMVAVELGFKDYPKASQLDAILQLQSEGLILKSRCRLSRYAVETSQELEYELYGESEEGDPHFSEPYFSGEAVLRDFEYFTLGKSSLMGDNTLSIWNVIFEETEYYILDESGFYLENYYVKLEDVCVSREDLRRFMSSKIKQLLPPYANPSSRYFAPELAAAIKAHEYYIVRWKGNPAWGVEQRLLVGKEETLVADKVLTNRGKRIRAMIGTATQIAGDPEN